MGSLDSFFNMLGLGTTAAAAAPPSPIAKPVAKKNDEEDSDEETADFDESIPRQTQRGLADADAAGDLETVAPPPNDQKQLPAAQVVNDEPPATAPKAPESVQAGSALPETNTTVPPSSPLLASNGPVGNVLPSTESMAPLGVNQKNIASIIQKLIGDESFSDKALAQAQEQSNYNRLVNAIGKGASMIGAGIAGAKPQLEAYNDLEKHADAPVKALMNRQQLVGEKLKHAELATKLSTDADASDATSDVSKFTRENVKQLADKLGRPINIPITATAKQLEGIQKMLQIEWDKKMTIEGAEGRAKAGADKKHNEKLEDRFKKYGEDIDPFRGRSGELGKNQGRINAANRLDKLITQFPDFNVPKNQTTEIATAVNSLLTNGSQNAVSQINHLTPSSMIGNAKDIAAWITGTPLGREQQEFIKMLYHTAQREREEATRQNLTSQFDKANGTHGSLKDENPERWYKMLSQFSHMPVDQIKHMESDPSYVGQYMPEYNQEHLVQQFMKKNKIDSRDKALDDLKSKGFLPSGY